MVSNEALTALTWFTIETGFPERVGPSIGYNDVLRWVYDALFELNLGCDFVSPDTEDLDRYAMVERVDRRGRPLLHHLDAFASQPGIRSDHERPAAALVVGGERDELEDALHVAPVEARLLETPGGPLADVPGAHGHALMPVASTPMARRVPAGEAIASPISVISSWVRSPVTGVVPIIERPQHAFDIAAVGAKPFRAEAIPRHVERQIQLLVVDLADRLRRRRRAPAGHRRECLTVPQQPHQSQSLFVHKTKNRAQRPVCSLYVVESKGPKKQNRALPPGWFLPALSLHPTLPRLRNSLPAQIRNSFFNRTFRSENISRSLVMTICRRSKSAEHLIYN